MANRAGGQADLDLSGTRRTNVDGFNFEGIAERMADGSADFLHGTPIVNPVQTGAGLRALASQFGERMV